MFQGTGGLSKYLCKRGSGIDPYILTQGSYSIVFRQGSSSVSSQGFVEKVGYGPIVVNGQLK